VLIHVANHGTDHRAQLLALLNQLGVKTFPQDYFFFIKRAHVNRHGCGVASHGFSVY
jgi:uncharacterized damage-inducible protein DinB